MHNVFFRRPLIGALLAGLALSSIGFASQFDWSKPEPGEELSGGDTTIFETNRSALPAMRRNM